MELRSLKGRFSYLDQFFAENLLSSVLPEGIRALLNRNPCIVLLHIHRICKRMCPLGKRIRNECMGLRMFRR